MYGAPKQTKKGTYAWFSSLSSMLWLWPVSLQREVESWRPDGSSTDQRAPQKPEDRTTVARFLTWDSIKVIISLFGFSLFHTPIPPPPTKHTHTHMQSERFLDCEHLNGNFLIPRSLSELSVLLSSLWNGFAVTRRASYSFRDNTVVGDNKRKRKTPTQGTRWGGATLRVATLIGWLCGRTRLALPEDDSTVAEQAAGPSGWIKCN